MAAISEFFSHLSTMTRVFLTLLLLHIVLLLQSLTRSFCNSGNRQITGTQFLKLIEEKNPTILYRIGLNSSEIVSRDCAVCLSRFEEGEKIRRLQCKHTFHKDCLDRWLQQDHATCPLCRRDVLPEEIASKYCRRLQSHDDQEDYYGSDDELIFLLSALHGNNLHGIM